MKSEGIYGKRHKVTPRDMDRNWEQQTCNKQMRRAFEEESGVLADLQRKVEGYLFELEQIMPGSDLCRHNHWVLDEGQEIHRRINREAAELDRDLEKNGRELRQEEEAIYQEQKKAREEK